MKWVLHATIVAWILFYISYKSADRPGDDFGAVIPALLFLFLGGVLTIVYIGMIFWNHAFPW